MSRIPDWNAEPELWDTVKLGDATLPGTCTVEGVVGIHEDIQEVPGGTARVNVLNYTPASITITVMMTEQEHLDKYKEIVKVYGPKKNLERPPLEVLHPTLSIHDIRQLYVFEMDLPERVTVGQYRAVIRLREWWEEREELEVAKVAAPAVPLADASAEQQAPPLTDLAPSSEGTPPLSDIRGF